MGETARIVSDHVSVGWHMCDLNHDRRWDHENLLPDHLWGHMQHISTDDNGVVRGFHLFCHCSGSISQSEFDCWGIPHRSRYCHKLLLADMGSLCLQK